MSSTSSPEARALPIYEIEHELIAQLPIHHRLILQAPTGSGKSTQIPQILLDHGLLGEGQAVILQPRRLAARMLATRVASERHVPLGSEVGYQIRFENHTSNKTRIRFVTEGILLRQMLSDPRLDGIQALLFDEFHERHLYGDITLARALMIQATTRPDLLILVMSATLQIESLQRHLHPCSLLTSKGQTYPVTIDYLSKSVDSAQMPIWEQAVEAFEKFSFNFPEGDALIFMPGAYEIQRTLRALSNSRASQDFILLPLHGELSPSQQDAAIARHSKRKIVVSTNVAETSLTIEGIRLVIDSGLARIPCFDPHRGINTLLIEKISRASADQRAGRAGRTAPGHCLRLWTSLEHETRATQEIPEVKRLDLSEVILTLKASGVNDIRNFRWLEAPDSKAIDRAEILLQALGAIDSVTGDVTTIGRRMLSFPVHPRYSRMLLAAHERGCVRAIALIAALTQGRSLWMRSEGKRMDEARDELFGERVDSDFFLLMRAWTYASKNNYDLNRCRRFGIHASTARQIASLFDFFLKIAQEQKLDTSEKSLQPHALEKCLLVGFSDQLALRADGGTLRCHLIHGRVGHISRDSVVHHAPLVVAGEVREVEGRDKELNVLLTLVTAVKEEWLRDIFPNDFHKATSVFYDSILRRVVSEERTLFRDLVLHSKKTEKSPHEEAAKILAKEVMDGRLTLHAWDDTVEQWILRLNCLSKWCPEFTLPPLDEKGRLHLIEQFCLGSTSYKEIKDKPIWPILHTWLSVPQQACMDQHAPTRYTLPNKRTAKIAYRREGPPILSARIQDLYGVSSDLTIAMGKIPLVIQILAPNHRPVQITQNLKTFWRDAYPKIKQELQRKYPKHEWR